MKIMAHELSKFKREPFPSLVLREKTDSQSALHVNAPPVMRPRVSGKFIYIGDTKFVCKGVTYGAFKPDETDNEYHDLAKIERDFAQMAANGINTVRIPHRTPPVTLLDCAIG